MGWWNTVKRWGISAWSNAFISNVINSTLNTSYKTVVYLFAQASAVPKLLYSVATENKSRTVAGHLLRIAAEDVAPFVLVSYVNDSIQQYGQAYLGKEGNQAWLSYSFFLQSSLFFLNTATTIYAARNKMETLVRTAVVTIEAPNALEGKIQPMTICEEEKCTTLRFLKGSFRDLIAYYGTEVFIQLVAYIPVAGGTAASMLSVYHHGRYVTTLILPICGRHQTEYLNEHAEFALAQGISHAMISSVTSRTIESITGVPRSYYESAVQQLAIVIQVGMTANTPLPPAVKKSNRNAPDPLRFYVTLTNDTVDALISGLKKQIPIILKREQAPSFPWNKASKIAVQIWKNPIVNRVKPILLPSMLRSPQEFINDSFISSHWDGLRDKMIKATVNISAISDKYLVQLAVKIPTATSETVWVVFGTPKVVTQQLLKLISNEDFKVALESFRRKLESMHRGAPPPITISQQSYDLRSLEKIEKTLSVTTEDELKGQIMPLPAAVCTEEISLPPPFLKKTKQGDNENTHLRNRIIFFNEEDSSFLKKKTKQVESYEVNANYFR